VYLDIKSYPSKAFSKTLRPDDCYLLAYWKNGEGEQFPGWGKYDDLVELERGEYQ
jgi:hypothetical protein